MGIYTPGKESALSGGGARRARRPLHFKPRVALSLLTPPRAARAAADWPGRPTRHPAPDERAREASGRAQHGMSFKPPVFADVTAAAARLAATRSLHRTPLLESVALNLLTGARVLVKAEALQIAGSFKIRGAMNRVLCLSPEERNKGVVAFSSGNFGQGLAAACMFEKVKCTIVMPGDAPVSKEERARSYGAEVLRSEIIEGVNREVTAAELADSISDSEGATLLHPFEDFHVMAGQGTCALEILEQCEERQIGPIDALLVPTGGGGLSAGCCLAMAERSPDTGACVRTPLAAD
eukprot:COSAG06_NODE_1171_length_10418_cov_8.441216_8_plen_295_part_00